jgi:hypothetical protein
MRDAPGDVRPPLGDGAAAVAAAWLAFMIGLLAGGEVGDASCRWRMSTFESVLCQCRMPNAECRMPNAECRMPNAEC